MEALLDFDHWLLLTINGSYNAFQDALWWNMSSRASWILIGLALIVLLIREAKTDWRRSLLTLIALALAITLADQLSSGLIKHLVERPRPTHNAVLASMLHIVNDYRGGMYGFVSSHAANAFAAVTLVSLLASRHHVTIALTLWALLQCYSRVYLGVHYPTDIAGGTIVGIVVGATVYAAWRLVARRLDIATSPLYNPSLVTTSVIVSIASILTFSLIQY